MPESEQPLRAELERLAEEIRLWREAALYGPEGIDDLTLAGYVSGELNPEQSRRVATLLETAPELKEIVDVVRATLADDSWRREPLPGKLHLRPPALSTLALGRRQPPRVSPSATTTPVTAASHATDTATVRPASREGQEWNPGGSIRRWSMPLAAMAAALLVGVTLWTAREALTPPNSMHVQNLPTTKNPVVIAAKRSEPEIRLLRCTLLPNDTIVERKLVTLNTPLRSGEQFQIELAVKEATEPSIPREEFTVLHVAANGAITMLTPDTGFLPRQGNALILPASDETYTLDDSTGLETLVAAPREKSELLLAQAERVLDDVLASHIVRGGDQKLSREQIEQFLARMRSQFGAVSSVVEHRPK